MNFLQKDDLCILECTFIKIRKNWITVHHFLRYYNTCIRVHFVQCILIVGNANLSPSSLETNMYSRFIFEKISIEKPWIFPRIKMHLRDINAHRVHSIFNRKPFNKPSSDSNQYMDNSAITTSLCSDCVFEKINRQKHMVRYQLIA